METSQPGTPVISVNIFMNIIYYFLMYFYNDNLRSLTKEYSVFILFVIRQDKLHDILKY